MFKTTDLYDDYLETLQVAAPVFRDFGGRIYFSGQIVTLKALEDNINRSISSFMKTQPETAAYLVSGMQKKLFTKSVLF